MSSTFGGLNLSFRGLTAASQGINVTGQNIANVGTPGYTRQRLDLSGAAPAAHVGLFSSPSPRVGQGVSIDGISRMGNVLLDGRVRSTAADASNTAARAETLSDIEGILAEPGKNGLSTRLSTFFASWQDVANNPSESAPAGVLLEEGRSLVGQIGSGYVQLEEAWGRGREKLDGLASEINSSASRIAELNSTIRSTLAAGGSANELIDQRDALATHVSSLAGGTVRESGNGQIEVLIGGNALVSGEKAYEVKTSGARNMSTAAGDPPRLEWVGRSVTAISLSSGEAAGTISTLAAADSNGTGGSIAEAAASYNALAESLASAVNTIHRTGETSDGRTGLDFFTFNTSLPAARGITVAVGVPDLASRAPGLGGNDGSVADLISQAGTGKDSPTTQWNSFVTKVGVDSRAAIQSGVMAEQMASSATAMQLAGASVGLDEETMNLMSFQHAYQANARVMAAIDEVLETIINLGR